MAITGIAGCTGLILAGFGIKNSIEDLQPKQFNEILHFQGIVTMDQAETLPLNALITDDMNAVVESLSVENEKNSSQTVRLISPSNLKVSSICSIALLRAYHISFHLLSYWNGSLQAKTYQHD